MKFTKMHGLGNDFVVIDAVTQTVPVSEKFMRAIADRHYGVGCDQVLLVTKTTHSQADFGYRIFNADGNEVYQCGNGARCVGLFIQSEKLSDKTKIVLATQKDFITVTVFSPEKIQVEMSRLRFEDVPTNVLFHCVNVGNPHAVFFVDVIDANELKCLGEMMNHDPTFPEGVNVSFAKINSRNAMELMVYERGVGFTKACGSAAVAAVTIGRKLDKLDAEVTVFQPGGQLIVRWEMMDSLPQLIGPAAIVFRGIYCTGNDCGF